MSRIQLYLCFLVSFPTLSYWYLKKLQGFPAQSYLEESYVCNGEVDPEELKPGIEAFDQRKGDPSTIHIALLFDERGRKMVVGAVRSILATTEHPVEFHLVCSPGEDKALIEKFGNAGPRAGQIHFYDYSVCKDFFDKVRHMMGRLDPIMNLCRMMLPDILPSSLERVLFMDADVTVVRDLGPIFHVEFNEDEMIGHSMDTYGPPHRSTPWPRAYEVEIAAGLCESSPYYLSRGCNDTSQHVFDRMQFNGGIGVYDLRKFRERKFTSTIAEYIEEGYKMSGNNTAAEPSQDSMNSYYRKHPKVSKALPCGANYQFRSEWKTVYCANKDVYIAHSYNPGENANIEGSPYGKRMMYFWGDCTDCCGMPDVPLTSAIDEKMNVSGLKPLLRYTAGCPHQPYYHCTNGVPSLNGFVLNSSLH